ncbi:unnamed protein product [Clonostachys rosea f. rosea IK726]|uniref:Uncharacterized protein n=1 Tax=Clonostachys rosea f. rosea IK726 TaxID=1349383 RepID=A0ACA9UT94_BIOOC|nr:unnamed protein product [Clonostachys rosea f. rosea IK726]
MGILLEGGADVDAVAPCDPYDFDLQTPILRSDFAPPGLHTTIAESVFYRHPHFFNQFLRYTRVQQGHMSQARLLQAAVEGRGALTSYLQTLTADISEVKWHLESCLAKAFLLKVTDDSSFIERRIKLIHNLLISGTDPTLPSICGVVSVQSMLDYLIMWGQDWIEEENELLPECFNEVTGQLLRHGALWDKICWHHIVNGDSLGILPMLGSLGIDFKSLDGEALRCAVRASNLEAVRWLLDAGADYFSSYYSMGPGFQWTFMAARLLDSCTAQ